MAAATPDALEVRDILDRALRLPAAEREGIALRLLESIGPPPNLDADWEHWKIEIRRRIEDVERGRVQPVSPDEMFENVQRALAEGRGS